MDNWQAAQSWLLFSGVVSGLGAYYYYSHQSSGRPALPKKRVEDEARSRRTSVQDVGSKPSKDATKKRKAPRKEKEQPKSQEAPTVVVQHDNTEEKEDMTARHFAEQMTKARQGANLSSTKSKENRAKTVKQSIALNTPILSGSSEGGADADADDDLSPAPSPGLNAGDVSDMLEPTAKGPSTLRLTAPSQPQKQKINRQPKEEAVETKKQRQNRQKKEQQRLEREAEEKDRKGLEERQRRAARESRGEPAKNGLGVSKAPANNAWTAPKETQQPQANGTSAGPLLDTFDAESSASSNGGMGASTAATSTTEAETVDREQQPSQPSEEEQVAKALRESEDESGWTTVSAVPKKQKTVPQKEISGNSTPVEASRNAKTAPSAPKAAEKGKANGYLALNVEGDANDPSTWEA